MSRDMCEHGFNVRERLCVDCATPDELRAELKRLAEPDNYTPREMRLMEQRDAALTRAEAAEERCRRLP